MIPETAFDALAIVVRLERSLDRVLPSEIHLFGYLACLLSLYNGQPVADWGYTFAGTKEGSPFSPKLADAIASLRGSGDLEGDSQGLRATENGSAEYELLRTLSQNAGRELYIAGACDSVLALPVGVVRSAMSNEPALRRAASLGSTRRLLERVDVSVLYEQFDALTTALGGDVREFMVPAVTWLTYLVRTAIGPALNAGAPELG